MQLYYRYLDWKLWRKNVLLTSRINIDFLFGINLLSVKGVKPSQCSKMIILQFCWFFQICIVIEYRTWNKRFIKNDYKIILEISWYCPRIFSCITDNLTFVRYNFHIWSIVECIYEHISTASLWKLKTKRNSPLSKSDFCRYIVIGKVYTIIVWFFYFRLMQKPARPQFFSYFWSTSFGKYRKWFTNWTGSVKEKK